MDDDRALDSYRKVFVGGEGSGDVLRADVESRKASHCKHAESASQVGAGRFIISRL